MGGLQARRSCPQAIVVPPRMSAYTEASRAVFEVFADTTPLVEGLSIDEAFLDVGGLRRISGTPAEIAVRLRRDVLDQVGLPITVGVARTKFLAKVASGVAKPDGLLVVPPDGELAFLHPLPVRAAVGRGARRRRPSSTNGGSPPSAQVARLPEARAGGDAGQGERAGTSTPWPTTAIPGPCRWGVDAARSARNGPWAGGGGRGTIWTSWSWSWSTGWSGRMRDAGRVGRTVVVRLRFDDFTRVTRSHTLLRATAETHTILTAARALLATAMPLIEHRGCTLVGLAVSNLDNADAVQLALPFDGRSSGALDAVLDELRERYGSSAVTRAVQLGRHQGQSMPMLPD